MKVQGKYREEAMVEFILGRIYDVVLHGCG